MISFTQYADFYASMASSVTHMASSMASSVASMASSSATKAVVATAMSPPHPTVGFVYFLYCPTINQEYHLIKIGQTKNDVNRRVKQLQTGNPFAIQIYAVVKLENYKQVERVLHAKYSKRRYLNEWFHLTLAEVEHEVQLLQRQGNSNNMFTQTLSSSTTLFYLQHILAKGIIAGYQLIDHYFVSPSKTTTVKLLSKRRSNCKRRNCSVQKRSRESDDDDNNMLQTKQSSGSSSSGSSGSSVVKAWTWACGVATYGVAYGAAYKTAYKAAYKATHKVCDSFKSNILQIKNR